MATTPSGDEAHFEAWIPEHPNVPRRAPLLLAIVAIAAAGLLGALIGWGLVDVSCDGGCTAAATLGALVGGAAAAAGAGVVAVLVLRTMTEWRHHSPGRPRSG